MKEHESNIEKYDDDDDLFLTIPQNILEKLNLNPGDEVEIDIKDDKSISIKKVNKNGD